MLLSCSHHPEPSTLVLGGFGLIGLAFTARKVRKAKAA